MKIQYVGIINIPGNPLHGCKAELINRTQTGFKVKLIEDKGAYKKGAVIIVGSGEFKS